MSKEKFRNKRFKKSIGIKLSNGSFWSCPTGELLDSIVITVRKYQDMGIKMTLRQLYYQLVASDIIPNDIKVYSKLSTIVTDARYNGLIDWEAIVDRVRVPVFTQEWQNIKEIVETAINAFRLPRWEDQDYYIEVLTEKDALSSVLEPICHKYHVTFCVNRGYGSASAIYRLSKRLLYYGGDKKVVILYLGDHDPSGLDMIRDIEDRLREFILPHWNFKNTRIVEHIALTSDQVEEYKPPPNPAKFSDPRAGWYIDEHGQQSWEVDALPPDVMIKLVEEKIQEYLDMDLYQGVIDEENRQRERLSEILEEM